MGLIKDINDIETSKKYRFTGMTRSWDGHVLHQIVSEKDFQVTHLFAVEKGQLGGWIESEDNLSQDDNCWVDYKSYVCGNAKIYGNALVDGSTVISGNAQIFGNSLISGSAWVSEDAQVYGNAQVYSQAQVSGHAKIYGDAQVWQSAKIEGTTQLFGKVEVFGRAYMNSGKYNNGKYA